MWTNSSRNTALLRRKLSVFKNENGLDVYSNDKKVGVVVGVSNNGANDLLSVRGLSKKISLIPFVDELVPEVDLDNKKVYINEIQGLIE